MKKFLSVLFAIAIAIMPLSLVGCGTRKMKLIETTLPAQYKFTVNYKYWENNTLKSDTTYSIAIVASPFFVKSGIIYLSASFSTSRLDFITDR